MNLNNGLVVPEIAYPDYNNSILCIPNSILRAYGATPFHKTHPLLDEKLAKFKNVVLLVFDGMGSIALSKLVPKSFLAKRKALDLSSVYPPTTAAAMTTLYSGLAPVEHGWLGWSCYFKEEGALVDVLTNQLSGTSNQAAAEKLGFKCMPYRNITDLVKETSPETGVYPVSPFEKEHRAYDCNSILAIAKKLLGKDGRKLIIAYNENPDHEMHMKGSGSEAAREMLSSFSVQVEAFASLVKDTLILITADHGHIDVQEVYIEDFPEVHECLELPLSLESRCISLFVKDRFKGVFEERWNNRFNSAFKLFSRQEALDSKLFGEGPVHRKSLDFIGDYVACAVSNVSVKNGFYRHKMHLSAHAGLTVDEMLVPLIVIET
jgi:hypothetical protein